MTKLIIILLLFFTATCSALQRHELPCSQRLFEASLDSARSQVGVVEKTGKNDGYEVESYLRSVGLGKGNPYCAAGQYWTFYTASQDLGLPTSYIPLARTGGAMAMYNAGVARGKRTDFVVKCGDLMFWKRPNSWQGHVERVIDVMRSGWVQTIGFNTTSGKAGNQANGDGVYTRKRNYKHFLGRLVVRGFLGFKTERSCE